MGISQPESWLSSLSPFGSQPLVCRNPRHLVASGTFEQSVFPFSSTSQFVELASDDVKIADFRRDKIFAVLLALCDRDFGKTVAPSI